MRSIRILLAAVGVASAVTSSAVANGGGYSRGGVAETGSISGFQPADTAKVRIMDEQLTIGLGRNEARVEVRYVLKNTSRGSAKVRFGFPVEEMKDRDPFAVAELPTKAGKERKSPEYCRDYKVDVSGKRVPATFRAEPDSAKAEDPRRIGLKGWQVSEVAFREGEEKTMTISYRADYPYSAFFVSDDGTTSARKFAYRLSSGACWEGPIERGRVLIRPEGANPSEVKILKPANRFQKVKEEWLWTFENLEPTLADDIVVEAAPEETSYGGRTMQGGFPKESSATATFAERDGKWYVRHRNYSVTASSTLPPQDGKTYEASNIRKHDAGPVWSEGVKGNGVGEWLELKPEVPKPLSSISIRPGFADNDELFKANARPKRIEVTLNDSYRFDAMLDDRDELQEIAVSGFDQPVSKIRLTIREVYPGSRFEDLCISYVAIENRLSKKPKIQPVR